MLAALKFFLGQDEVEAGDSDDEDEEDAPRLLQPSKADIYKATKKVERGPYCVVHAYAGLYTTPFLVKNTRSILSG